MKLGSLFDGSGGFPAAGLIAGMETAWTAEIEPFPRLVSHTRFPNAVQLGDVTKINGAEIEPVDVICAGSPCFPAGTLVMTDKGYRPIEELNVGIPEPTEEDIDYWVEAFRQFGKTKTRAQVAKWLKDPHSDSAEYKMWGNGIALPNAADVLCRVARYLHETEA